jgi:hypothetical protein
LADLLAFEYERTQFMQSRANHFDRQTFVADVQTRVSRQALTEKLRS